MKQIGLYFLQLLVAYQMSAQSISWKEQEWLAQPLLKGGSISVHLVDCETGEPVMGLDENRSLTPASIVKIIPSGLLLQQFASSHTFTTQLLPAPNARIVGDTLDGNLWLIGGGDPSLASQRMTGVKPVALLQEEWIAALTAAGIRHIRGGVVGMSTVFPDARIPGGYSVMDAGNYYATPSSGLSWQDNSYQLVLQSGMVGARASIVKTIPNMPGLQHVSYLIAEGSRDNAYIYGMPGAHQRQVIGSIPPNRDRFIIKGAVPDPALFAAQQVQRLLQERGITFSLAATTDQPDWLNRNPLSEAMWTNTSPALSELLRHTLSKSDNHFAETWVRWLFPSAPDPWRALQQAFADQLSHSFTGRLIDGSGLSRYNALSAKDFTAFLTAMYQSPRFGDYIDVMAVAGQSGTLRLIQLPASFSGTIYGKSGYMTGVRSYAGYYRSASGRWYAFAMIANNFNGSAGQMREAFTEVMSTFDQLP